VAIGPGGAHASAGRGPRPFSCSASRLGPFYTTRPGCPFFSPSRAHTSFTRFPTHFTGRAGAALLCTAARDDEYRVLFCSVLCSLPHSPPPCLLPPEASRHARGRRGRREPPRRRGRQRSKGPEDNRAQVSAPTPSACFAFRFSHREVYLCWVFGGVAKRNCRYIFIVFFVPSQLFVVSIPDSVVWWRV
jgi:hypothetical protein